MRGEESFFGLRGGQGNYNKGKVNDNDKKWLRVFLEIVNCVKYVNVVFVIVLDFFKRNYFSLFF